MNEIYDATVEQYEAWFRMKRLADRVWLIPPVVTVLFFTVYGWFQPFIVENVTDDFFLVVWLVVVGAWTRSMLWAYDPRLPKQQRNRRIATLGVITAIGAFAAWKHDHPDEDAFSTWRRWTPPPTQ